MIKMESGLGVEWREKGELNRFSVLIREVLFGDVIMFRAEDANVGRVEWLL